MHKRLRLHMVVPATGAGSVDCSECVQLEEYTLASCALPCELHNCLPAAALQNHNLGQHVGYHMLLCSSLPALLLLLLQAVHWLLLRPVLWRLLVQLQTCCTGSILLTTTLTLRWKSKARHLSTYTKDLTWPVTFLYLKLSPKLSRRQCLPI
jgi:hypothetical protein